MVQDVMDKLYLQYCTEDYQSSINLTPPYLRLCTEIRSYYMVLYWVVHCISAVFANPRLSTFSFTDKNDDTFMLLLFSYCRMYADMSSSQTYGRHLPNARKERYRKNYGKYGYCVCVCIHMHVIAFSSFLLTTTVSSKMG